MKELTEYDQLLLGEKGIKVSKLQEQVAIFLAGVPPVNLVAPAHVGSGILSFSREDAIQYVATYQKKTRKWACWTYWWYYSTFVAFLHLDYLFYARCI